MRKNPVLILALLVALVFGAGQWVDRVKDIREKQAAEKHWQETIELSKATIQAVNQVDKSVKDFRVVKLPPANLFKQPTPPTR